MMKKQLILLLSLFAISPVLYSSEPNTQNAQKTQTQITKAKPSPAERALAAFKTVYGSIISAPKKAGNYISSHFDKHVIGETIAFAPIAILGMIKSIPTSAKNAVKKMWNSFWTAPQVTPAFFLTAQGTEDENTRKINGLSQAFQSHAAQRDAAYKFVAKRTIGLAIVLQGLNVALQSLVVKKPINYAQTVTAGSALVGLLVGSASERLHKCAFDPIKRNRHSIVRDATAAHITEEQATAAYNQANKGRGLLSYFYNMDSLNKNSLRSITNEIALADKMKN